MASNLIVSAGTVPAATGMSWQGHLFWAENDAAWWWIGITSTSATTLVAYRSPDLVTWTAKTTKAMAATLNGEGRNLRVVYKNISSTDVVQLVYTNTISSSSHKLNTIRATISGGAITYGTEQLVVAGTANNSLLAISGLGACFSDDNFLYIGLPDPTATAIGDTVAYKASNADLGSSWTTGFAAQVQIDTSIGFLIGSCCVTPLASHKVLLCYDNGAANPPTSLKNVLEKTLTVTTISPTPAGTAGNSVFTALGTAIDDNNYGIARVSDTDTHAVLRTASNTFSHKRFNGTNWTTVSGAAVPNQTSKADAGIFLTSNGTDVWMFIIDSDAANTVRYIKWTASGNSWDASWTALETTTKVRKFISGCIKSDGSAIGIIWSETNGSNFDVMSELLTFTTQISAADTGSGTETATVIVALNAAESATGNDPATIAAALPTVDTGSGLENAVIGILAAETATGNDVATIIVVLAGPDTANAIDTATPAISQTAIDTANGLDAATIATIRTVAESASGLDGATLSALASGNDLSSTTLDNATILVAAAAIEAATGQDLSNIIASIPVVEAATGNDLVSLVVNLTPGDIATAVDAATVNTGGATVTGPDTGLGVDAATVNVIVTGAENALGLEQGSIGAFVNATETGNIVDNAIAAAAVAASDLGVGLENTTQNAVITAFENITGLDFATVLKPVVEAVIVHGEIDIEVTSFIPAMINIEPPFITGQIDVEVQSVIPAIITVDSPPVSGIVEIDFSQAVIPATLSVKDS